MVNKKKIKRSIESFEKQIQDHSQKIEDYKEQGGKDYILLEYWEKEIRRLENWRKEKEEKLKK